ncbi:hypothetical protein BKA82DRAFT_4017995 [Pisolithus tinctorius]|nr:hypothetical protein BKA82DRAFT_4017995 [Pisolithus tinctorius]
MTTATTTSTAEMMTMAMLSATMTVMVLGEGRRLCKAGMAIQREQSQRQIPTVNYVCNRRAYSGLQLKIVWVYSKTSTKTMRISKSQQDAQDVRSIEAMPSGLEGPSLSLLFKLFYLQLPHFRDHEFLQSINESLSVDVLTVQRSRLGRPATASLQDEDAYITVDQTKGDSIPVLDIVQRHHEVSFYLGDITDEWDVLDILERSGVTYVVQNALLCEPRLDPEGTTAKLNESLHHTLPPICATTEYHRMTQTLSSYVAPTPNTESILSAFNTPFDPCGLMDPVVCSRSDGQASFITNGEAFVILDFTRVYNEYEQKPSHLKVQGKFSVYEEVGVTSKWLWCGSAKQHTRTNTGLSNQSYTRQFNSSTMSGGNGYSTREKEC